MSGASTSPGLRPITPAGPGAGTGRGPAAGSVTGLGRRLTVMAALVALASVLVTGVTMIGLFRQGATQAARSALGRDADTVAATVEGFAQRPLRRQEVRTATINRQLARRGIVSAIATVPSAPTEPATSRATASAGTLPPPFTPADLTTMASAGTVSRTARASGQEWLVEGRRAGADAVLLAQPVDQGVAQNQTPRRRLGLPLLLGLLGGGLAGWLMARRLVRPLDQLAAAARRLSSGDRQVRAPVEGPAEIAQLGLALNGLAEALAGSEERQRRFLMDVSHELRTPLTAVAGYAEGLADGEFTGAQVAPAADVIRTEAARLSRRVDDLLALARMEADDFRLELGPAGLTELVQAAALAWRPRAQAAQVRLEVQAPAGPVRVVTDAERLRQAMDALADNALRVLSPGSLLILGCGGDEHRAWISVSDDGPGLADADLPVAFERGHLTERYRGDRPVGSGLGLALVGELARRLGGQAVATRSPAGGVTFAVVLPR